MASQYTIWRGATGRGTARPWWNRQLPPSPVLPPYGGGINQIPPQLQFLLEFLKQGQKSQDQARQANESRYQDILKLFGDTRGRVLGGLNDLGTSQINDANRNWDLQRANQLADLAERGLGGSTARAGVESGVQRERNAEINRIRDAINQQVVAADERFADKAGNVMENRTDAYPDLSWLTGAAGQLGQLPGNIFGQLFQQPQYPGVPQQPGVNPPGAPLYGWPPQNPYNRPSIDPPGTYSPYRLFASRSRQQPRRGGPYSPYQALWS